MLYKTIDLVAPIEIPCYFDHNLNTSVLASNNMGWQWEQLNLTVIGLVQHHFFEYLDIK